MEILGSTFRSEEFGGRVKRLALFNATFDPNFIDTLVLPVGKKTDAVTTRFDIVKVVFHCAER